MANLNFSRSFFLIVTLAFVVPIGLSCGSDTVEDNEWELDEANEFDKDAAECDFDRDCPDGMHCYGLTQCGATWNCQEDFPPCSAAPPSRGCSCDGEVVSIDMGCPRRHVWDFAQIRLVGETGYELGEPCDAELQFPVTISLAFSVDGFDSDVAGQQLRIRFEDSSIHVQVGEFDAWVAADGSMDFDISFEYEEHTEAALLFWWDHDGEGECSDEDMVWRGTPNAQDVDMNLETFEGEAAVDVRHLSEEQGFEEGEGCAHWDSMN